jgi:hypothetical protein
MNVFTHVALTFMAIGMLLSGAELPAGAIRAWEAYTQEARSQVDARPGGAKPFLWAQESEPGMRLVRSGRHLRPSSDRWCSISRSTRLQEIEHCGRADERVRPAGTVYVWRLYSSVRVSEVDGGVVFELEALALSREIPAGLAWRVDPIVKRISPNALWRTLRQTRDGVMG